MMQTEQISSQVSPLRVVVIEDLREIREGLAALINGTPGFECVASYGMMETALARIVSNKPDVILTDLGLPGMSGIEGIERLREIFPEIPIIALTIYDNDREIFNALCNGANGYLLKNTPPARLLEALQEAVEGGSPISPAVASRVVKLFRTFRPPEHADYQLTPQEITLLKLLIEGHHKKTAAREMGISINTISFHLKNIYEKLQVHSKTEAVAKALREKLF
ncbi:MAG TPA: response regulator transcription factor [Pyrinomonadaceae bacterium]|nr:response regulator transcription factor [Pyrinomonadaceae bacterium]